MRGLSNRFLKAMRKKLKQGRNRGYIGWDQHWERCVFPASPTLFLLGRLHNEIDELVIALQDGNSDAILEEAADVANFAMFLADITWTNSLPEDTASD